MSPSLWGDQCSECFAGAESNSLLCCGSCPRVFHLECAGLASMPGDNWDCSGCTEGFVRQYQRILEREAEYCADPTTCSALNHFVAEVLPLLRKVRIESFVVPLRARVPPCVRDPDGRVIRPGYARAFSYLGFRGDPYQLGEEHRRRVCDFHLSTYEKAWEDRIPSSARG